MHVRHWLIRSAIAFSLVLNLLAASLISAPAAQAQAVIPAAAGDENWDNRFGLPGTEAEEVEDIAVGANGDIYIAGRFSEVANTEVNQVARWDGRQFHALGVGLSGGSPDAIVTDGNTLYAVGGFTSAGFESAKGIARWDGAAWSAVGSGEGATDEWGSQGWLRAAAVYGGKLIVGGQFKFVDGVTAMNIAAWDGANWSALGGGIHGPEEWSIAEVRSLLAVGNKLYVAGNFEMAGNKMANSIAVWDGSTWSALGSGLQFVEGGTTDPGQVHALAYGNNTLYAGGYFNRAGGKAANFVAQYSNGAWSVLGSGVKDEDFSTDSPINDMVYANNTLYVGGKFVAAGGKPIDLLAAWNGAAWSEATEDGADGIPNDSGFDRVYSLAAAPSGLVVGGLFRLAGDKMVNNVTLLAGGEWLALGQGLGDDFGDTPGNPLAIASDEAGNIFIGGEFTRLGGVAAKNIGMWNGTRWLSLGDADSYVSALAVGDGFLYAGGNFTQIGGISAAHVAVMNLQTGQWSALGSGMNGEVNALAYSDGILYAGGVFDSAGNQVAEDVAWWDGAAWHPFAGEYRIFEIFDNGSEAGTFVNALAVAGDEVYIGGHFQTIQFGTNTADRSSFVVVHNVVSWNRATQQWSFVGTAADPGVTNNGFSGFGTNVHALALLGNSLFVGGEFNKAGGMAVTGLARWERAAEQWVSTEGSLGGTGFDDVQVRGLAPAGADLLVAGKFTSAGAAPARYIARFDTATNAWSNLGSGLRWYNDRFTQANVVISAPGGVYVGGKFDHAGEAGSLGFARWSGELGAPNVTPEQGGTVQADGVGATFPAGAVGEASVATLARTAGPAAPLPAGWAGVYGMQIAATTMSGRQLSQTVQPYALQATYTDAQLAAAGIVDASSLVLVAWNGTGWEQLAGSVDTANKIITGTTTQLGALALAGASVPGQNPDDIKLYLPSIRK